MSASLAAVTLRNATIAILPSFRTENLRAMKVEHSWMTGNGANAVDHSCKMYLPMCDDPSNKELLLYIVDQFLDAAHDDRLHLSAGPLHHTKSWDVIGGNLRVVWQEISGAQGAKSVESFMENFDVLVGCYLAAAACQDRIECLCTGTSLSKHEL